MITKHGWLLPATIRRQAARASALGTRWLSRTKLRAQCCDLLFDQALLDASDGRDLSTVKSCSFGLHQVRRHLIAAPRVEGLDTTTIMANLLVWASQQRAPAPATSSMMSMDRLGQVWALAMHCSNGLGGRECSHGRRAASGVHARALSRGEVGLVSKATIDVKPAIFECTLA